MRTTAVTLDAFSAGDPCFIQVRLALGEVLRTVHPALRACLGAAFADGKLIRPAITRGWFLAAGGLGDGWCLPATAVELVHRASLAHDDLPCMDDEMERRGRPTLHVKHGEDAAVLAGDAMIALAFETLVRGNGTPGMVGALSRTIAAMCGGQLAELRNNQPSNDDPRRVRRTIAEDKTGSLFVAAAELGVRAAGAAAPSLIASAEDFGCTLGRLYQAIDDIEDGDALAFDPRELTDDLARLKRVVRQTPRPHAILPVVDLIDAFMSRG